MEPRVVSRIAALSSPSSYTVAGATILSPGTRKNHDSGFCEWKSAPVTPEPEGPRTTIGTRAPSWPPCR